MMTGYLRIFGRACCLLLSSVLLGVLVVGCATGRAEWVLNVNNSGAEPIRDVKVQLDDGRGHSEPQIAGYAQSTAMQLGTKPPHGNIEVLWSSGTGAAMKQTVMVTNWTAVTSGKIVLEIKDDRPLRIFILNTEGQYLGEIPWGNSADWDGTVAFPVNQE